MTQEGFVNPELLANTAWLADHLNDPNLVVVDTDVAAGYARGHIPGAVLVPDNFEKDPDTDRTFILAPDKFTAMAEALGIGDDSLVVAYDSVGGSHRGASLVVPQLLRPYQRQGAERRLAQVGQ